MPKVREEVSRAKIPCPNCDGQGVTCGFKEEKGTFAYDPQPCGVCLGNQIVVRVHEVCYGNDVYYLKPFFEGTKV
jgi:DnaJ-class molecular chaperone